MVLPNGAHALFPPDHLTLVFAYPPPSWSLKSLDNDRARASAATISEKVMERFGGGKPNSIARVCAIAYVVDFLRL